MAPAKLATGAVRPTVAGPPAVRPVGWTIRRRFGLAMAVFAAAFLGLDRNPALGHRLAPLDSLTAEAAAHLIDWTGLEVHRQGAVLSHPGGFSYEIYYRCTGLVVVAFLAAGLLALPGGRRAKAWGLALGASMVTALNLLRLTALFWIGVRLPPVFDFAHRAVGEAAMLLAVLAFWMVWFRRHGRRPEGSAPTRPAFLPAGVA